MKSKRLSFMVMSAFGLALLCLASTSALAGNSTFVTASGQPIRWPNGGRSIPFSTDLGGLGPMTNAEAVAQTIAAFRQWEDIPTATASYVNAGSLPVDVDETNAFQFLQYVPGDRTNPIIYDEHGVNFAQIFGTGDGTLGFTILFYNLDSGEILKAAIVLNGGAMDSGQFSTSDFLAVQVHEIGHFSGLAHSVVNGDLAGGFGTTGPYPFDTFPRPASFDGLVETMYPFFIRGGGQETPHADDRAIFSRLYPEPDFFARTGTITGHIRLPDGAPTGGNVIARNLANPFADAVSQAAGNFGQEGVYTLNGLTPGAQYAIYVQPPGHSLTPAEFYNGAQESNNPDPDHPDEFTPVTAIAGRPRTGIDIIFNFPSSGLIPLEFLVAGYGELPLPFPFEIGGQRFDSVFFNTDGSLTFGDRDPYASIFRYRTSSLLGGPPRIAGLWTPLEPLISTAPPPPPPPPPPPGSPPPPPPPSVGTQFGGVVSFAETSDTFTVLFTNVPTLLPDFTPGGPNTFSITLYARRGGQRNRVTLSYGHLDAKNGLAGYSCGSSFTSLAENESDLSALPRGLIPGDGHTAIFEEFTNQDFDLQNRTLTFEMPGPFTDRFEPNNSLRQATHVSLPFNTAQEFANITPGDIDFYRFSARAGETLVAETVPGGPLDTLIGLFGPNGTLLASNDDTSYLFSRVIFTIPADGEYAVAVTTPPDFGFTGAGSDSGRYVLTINSYRGTVLPLNGDDVTTELPLRFTFPFAGRNWRSVWVSSNGNLTFGAPETINGREDLQLAGFLAGPPRIAPLFTDLDPSGSANGGVTGLVIAEQNSDSLTVHWISVPRVADVGTNSFSVTLNADGNIAMQWGAISSADFVNNGTIVGITEGQGARDPGPTDLSRFNNVFARRTTYEQFAVLELGELPRVFPSFDLNFDQLRFFSR